MVDERAVFKYVLIIYYHIGAAQIVRQVGTQAHRVVVRNLPVHTCSVGQLVVLPRHGIRAVLTEDFIGFCYLFQIAILAIILMEIVNRAKNVNAVDAIVQP